MRFPGSLRLFAAARLAFYSPLCSASMSRRIGIHRSRFHQSFRSLERGPRFSTRREMPRGASVERSFHSVPALRRPLSEHRSVVDNAAHRVRCRTDAGYIRRAGFISETVPAKYLRRAAISMHLAVAGDGALPVFWRGGGARFAPSGHRQHRTRREPFPARRHSKPGWPH